MQALEPLTEGKPVKPGYIEKREFEYKRHGTQALLAGMDVTTGEIIPLVRDARTEEDFADWLNNTLASDPYAAGWYLVMDRLNTHMSEGAVRAVAKVEGTTAEELGIKGNTEEHAKPCRVPELPFPQNRFPLYTEACILVEPD